MCTWLCSWDGYMEGVKEGGLRPMKWWCEFLEGLDVRRQFEVSLTPHVSPSGAPSRRPWVGAVRERWGDKVQAEDRVSE